MLYGKASSIGNTGLPEARRILAKGLYYIMEKFKLIAVRDRLQILRLILREFKANN